MYNEGLPFFYLVPFQKIYFNNLIKIRSLLSFFIIFIPFLLFFLFFSFFLFLDYFVEGYLLDIYTYAFCVIWKTFIFIPNI